VIGGLSWIVRLARALMLVLLVGVVARVVYELLMPVVPLVCVILVMIGVYVLVLRQFRR
jgi:hypothetical protein